MEHTELECLLQQGIAAARAGDRARARALLLQVIAEDEQVESAWLWLSGVVDDVAEQQICLENVLALNPDNSAAHDGLHWLSRQQPDEPLPLSSQAFESSRPVLVAEKSPAPPLLEPPETGLEAEELAHRPATSEVVLDPYGCPYCGGSVDDEGQRCAHCGQPVAVRQRKRSRGPGLGWLVSFWLLQALISWGEGFSVSYLVEMGQLPAWLTQSALVFLVGSALFHPEGLPGELVQFAGTVVTFHTILAVLCLLVAVGLALRFRGAYFFAFLLAGALVVGTGIGLLTQLLGWLPALFRLGLVALSLRWLVDSAPAFEWETRTYNADVDQDLKNDLDYYNRGLRYREKGMWAKAAAHWKVATQFDGTKIRYRTSLAQAYVRMGYPAAALAQADRALKWAPDDEELIAFRDRLASALE